MKIKKQLFFLISCLTIIAAGCASMSVNYDFDPQADFAHLKTYDWLPAPEPTKGDELTIKHIKFSVNQQLTAKGFSFSSENPDFLIAVHGGREKRVDVQQWGYVYGDRDYYHWGPHRHMPWPYLTAPRYDYEFRSGVDRYEYEVGTLILDFVDAKTKELIWRGSATGVIDPSRPSRETINEAVSKILENFPPVQNK